MRMRSINDAYGELKNSDPNTAMTLSGLRRLVGTGKIPSVRIGRRIIINYDNLLEYLRNPFVNPQVDDEQGTIRKIAK